jgi:hypothetical protein
MRKYQLTILLGLSTVIPLFATSVKALTFNYDYDKLRFIEPRPIESNVYLDLQGLPSQNEGFVAFYNQDPNAQDRGHRQIALNSRQDFVINNAPYYGTGRQGSPEQPPVDATRAASLIGSTGFFNFTNSLTNNGIQTNNIGFAFGQKKDRDFNKTWNLGTDILGVDWFSESTSPIEERIYRANPNDVEFGLYNGTTKIIDFEYSNFYALVDYGLTLSFQDDFESNFTDPLKVNKVSGLSSTNNALADAFLQDVFTTGNSIQLINSFDGDDILLKSGNGYDMFLLPFPIQMRVVTKVPESSFIWALLMFTVLVAIQARKKQNTKVFTK